MNRWQSEHFGVSEAIGASGAAGSAAGAAGGAEGAGGAGGCCWGTDGVTALPIAWLDVEK